MAGQFERLYYGAKGALYNKLHFDIFSFSLIRMYAGVGIVKP